MEAYNNESNAIRFSMCPQRADGSIGLMDYNLKCRALGIGMDTPKLVSEEAGATEGSGVGSGTTVVVNTNQQRESSGVMGNNMVNASGVDGVVSNVFNKEEIIKVDVEPTLRRDLCCETYACLGCCSGGQAFFFKLPDCLGGGCNMRSLFGECASTCKLIQKPIFCEQVMGFSCCDLSTMCSSGGDNDDTCIKFCTYSGQCTCCCLLQIAGKQSYACMRTFLKCWTWLCCWDTRCSCPPSSASPMQCTICGFGYRFYEHGGCGCRMRADTDEANATVTTNTTVVVVNS